MSSGPGKVPGPQSQMGPRPSEERQLERDYEAVKEARDIDRLAKAAERARKKGTIR